MIITARMYSVSTDLPPDSPRITITAVDAVDDDDDDDGSCPAQGCLAQGSTWVGTSMGWVGWTTCLENFTAGPNGWAQQ